MRHYCWLSILALLTTVVQAADPVLTINGGTTAYQVGQSAVRLDAQAIVSDADSPTSLDGGSLTITILSLKDENDAPLAPDSGDTLLVVGSTIAGIPDATTTLSVSTSGSLVLITPTINGVVGNSVTVASWSGGSGGTDLVLRWTREASLMYATAVVRAVGFQNVRGTSATIGTRTFGAVLTDGTASGPGSATTKIAMVAAPLPPTANAIAVTTLEDQSVTGTLVGSDPSGSSLTYVLGAQPSQGTATLLNSQTGSFSFVPTANWSGSSTFAYMVTNGQLSSSWAQVTVTVTAVNDKPSFRAGGNLTASGDGVAQTVIGWATEISPGGGIQEADQTVSFTVTNSANALFSVQPALSNAGTLTYTPAPGASGVATITITGQDNGGTVNGGNNQSIQATATITISAVDLPPAVDPVVLATVLGAHLDVLPNATISGPASWSLVTACSLGVLTIDSTTGRLGFVPTTAGSEVLTAKVVSTGGSTEFLVSVTVSSNDLAGRPQIISAPSVEVITAGQTWSYLMTVQANTGAILQARVSGNRLATVTKTSGNGFTIQIPTGATDTIQDLTVVVWDSATNKADAQRIFVRVQPSVAGRG